MLLVLFITFYCTITLTLDNCIGIEGAKALTPILKNLTQLTTLYLYGGYCGYYDLCRGRGWGDTFLGLGDI